VKVTQAFLGEHAVFYAQFDYLEDALPGAASQDWVIAQALVLQSAVATHAQLEEELLFTQLEPHTGQGGPLAVMRMEHEEIENTLDAIPEAADLDSARGRLLRVIQVARQHFAKEEQVLFPMADQFLNQEQLEQLGERWAERRRVDVRV
jgi:hemerythrin-like domain-containing protein